MDITWKQITHGITEKVNVDESSNNYKICYMPPHSVVHEEKTPKELRIASNTSSSEPNFYML